MMSVRLPIVSETDEFAIADPIKTPESKTEKPSGKEKKTKTQPER